MKPIGPACNLACRYCYPQDETPVREDGRGGWSSLSAAILRPARQRAEINFVWQGGEPLLAGLFL